MTDMGFGTHYRPKHEISENLMALPMGLHFSYGYEASEDVCKMGGSYGKDIKV